MQYLNDFTGIRATIQGAWRVTGGQFFFEAVNFP
jgi:hypothetical protein